MQLEGVHHLAIQVRELDRCAAFYRDVLGLKELLRHHREDGSTRSIWIALSSSGAPFLALEQVDGAAEPDPTFRRSQPGLLLLALKIPTDRRSALMQTLAEHGVVVEHQTRWSVYVRDPEGNRIAFSHHPDDPAGPSKTK